MMIICYLVIIWVFTDTVVLQRKFVYVLPPWGIDLSTQMLQFRVFDTLISIIHHNTVMYECNLRSFPMLRTDDSYKLEMQ